MNQADLLADHAELWLPQETSRLCTNICPTRFWKFCNYLNILLNKPGAHLAVRATLNKILGQRPPTSPNVTVPQVL